MERRERENQAGHECGFVIHPEPRFFHHVERKEESPIPAHDECEEYDAVVGLHQPKIELDWERPQSVQDIERVEMEVYAGGVVDHVAEEGRSVFRQQCYLDPPEVPVVLPSVEAIPRYGFGEIQHHGVSHRCRQSEVPRNGGSVNPGFALDLAFHSLTEALAADNTL